MAQGDVGEGAVAVGGLKRDEYAAEVGDGGFEAFGSKGFFYLLDFQEVDPLV